MLFGIISMIDKYRFLSLTIFSEIHGKLYLINNVATKINDCQWPLVKIYPGMFISGHVTLRLEITFEGQPRAHKGPMREPQRPTLIFLKVIIFV